MTAKSHPVVWLLSGFISCAILVTGILWWKEGGNPFEKKAPDPGPGQAVEPPAPSASPITPPAPAPLPAPADSNPVPPASGSGVADSVPAPEPPPVATPAREPAADGTPPDTGAPLSPLLQEAAGVPGVLAVSRFAALARDGSVPLPQITESAYQWGVTHLPAEDAPQENAPFDQVLGLLNTSTDPHERGMAAIALAGSGRSAEAVEAIQKIRDLLKAPAPEIPLIDEALRRASELPEPTPDAPDGSPGIRATPPEPKKSSLPRATPSSPPPAGQPAAAPRPRDRPLLPHEESAEEQEEENVGVHRINPDPEPPPAPAPKTAPQPPPMTVIPSATGGGAGQTTILPPPPK